VHVNGPGLRGEESRRDRPPRDGQLAVGRQAAAVNEKSPGDHGGHAEHADGHLHLPVENGPGEIVAIDDRHDVVIDPSRSLH